MWHQYKNSSLWLVCRTGFEVQTHFESYIGVKVLKCHFANTHDNSLQRDIFQRTKNCWLFCFWICDLWDISGSVRLLFGLHAWLCVWCLHQAWVECYLIFISRCVWMWKQDWLSVNDTHSRGAVDIGAFNTFTNWGSPTNHNWTMESLYGQTAGVHDDGSCNDSPVVISSYALQLELAFIGRHFCSLYRLHAFCIIKGHINTLICHCFLLDGGGNYDIVNNTVVSTPGPQNNRSQNASLKQSWEMNYQEAAIYLQVITSRGLCHFC